LLQALLNLAQNSLRAVRESETKELRISVHTMDGRALIRVTDSGVGISAPDQLFRPFRPGMDGTGLGLYISRAMVRSFGGELRYEPGGGGTCFVVELQMV
jgi:C4-dicarboxylate-specific signal transduction histidine kinase